MFDDNVDWAPENLASIPPGAVLAAMLDDIDLEGVSGFDRITVLQAHERMASHYQAQSYRAMTAVADAIAVEDGDCDHELAAEAAAAEIRAALRWTRRAADSAMALAIDLAQRLPSVWEALLAGAIDIHRAKTITYGTAHLPTDSARKVVDRVLNDAGLLTTGQLRAKIRKLAIEVDPDDAKRRYDQAVEDRRIVSEPTESGTANLIGIDLPPDRVATGMKHINQLAKSLRGGGEKRTMDQLRADVFLDLITGTGKSGNSGKGAVEIHTDLVTLTGLSEAPGELGGYGPVIADIARQVTEHQIDAEWRWTLVDPDTGRLVDTGTTRRRPTATQQRQVEARDPICVFPGCRMPAADCDLDHCQPWAQTHTTSTNNLSPLCRHDHNSVRHKHGWKYQPLPNGDYLWTSRLGHLYTTSGRPP